MASCMLETVQNRVTVTMWSTEKSTTCISIKSRDRQWPSATCEGHFSCYRNLLMDICRSSSVLWLAVILRHAVYSNQSMNLYSGQRERWANVVLDWNHCLCQVFLAANWQRRQLLTRYSDCRLWAIMLRSSTLVRASRGMSAITGFLCFRSKT